MAFTSGHSLLPASSSCPAHAQGVRALLLVLGLLAPGSSQAEPPVHLPPGTHTDAQGQLVSGRGLRETSDFLAKEIGRRGIAVQQIGPYGARGVELTRFLSQAPATPWLAIHVLRMSGKTLIFFVPRAKSATTP